MGNMGSVTAADYVTIDDTVNAAGLQSITINDLDRTVDGRNVARQKGEEVADYTYNYNSSGNVTTKSVYFYGALSLRALTVNEDACLAQTSVFRRAATISDTIDKDARDDIKSITYNDITGREKNEEVADYTQNYQASGAASTKQTYYYGSGAVAAGAPHLELQRGFQIEAARRQFRARLGLQGQGFAGKTRHIYGRGPGQHHPIHRHPIPGQQLHPISRPQAPHPHLARRSPIHQQQGRIRLQGSQLLQGTAGAKPGPIF
jgi:hypothetical protein